MKFFVHILLVFLFLPNIWCCKTNESVATNANTATITIAAPKIIFLNYALKRLPDGSKEVRLINNIISEGKFKNANISDNSYFSENIICSQLDKNDSVLSSIYIPNPLSKDFEFINDSGQLQRKHVELDSAEFSVRMQLVPETYFIQIKEVSGNAAENIHLLTTKIK